MTKQKSLRKSSGRLLFTAKILHNAMYLTFPYLGQITNPKMKDFKRDLDLNVAAIVHFQLFCDHFSGAIGCRQSFLEKLQEMCLLGYR